MERISVLFYIITQQGLFWWTKDIKLEGAKFLIFSLFVTVCKSSCLAGQQSQALAQIRQTCLGVKPNSFSKSGLILMI